VLLAIINISAGERIATPKSDIDLIKRRLQDAEFDYAERFGKEQKP